MQEYPKVRLVTTGAPEYMDGLISLDFVPIAVVALNRDNEAKFTQRWGDLWEGKGTHECWARKGPAPVAPALLNTWLSSDTIGLTPLEVTLKVWGAYAGDTPGPRILEAIASHIRRLAPQNTPVAALEALAMQVTLTAQPVFDPRKARDWVKSFELPEEMEAKSEEISDEGEDQGGDEVKKDQGRDRRKSRTAPSPTPGLLGRLATSGLLLSHPNNKMRFVHPVIGGYLAGQALTSFKADGVLVNH